MKILITGANGWVGRALCVELLHRGSVVTGLVRRTGNLVTGVLEWLHPEVDFAGLNKTGTKKDSFDVLIHTAARAHVMDETESDELACYRAANTIGALRVAEYAKRSGIPRFVFVSSIKALGEVEPGRPWREDDQPVVTDPLFDPYGRSKREAEQALLELAGPSFEVIIVRPPLVYGPGVRANFLKLIKLVDRGWPLPLGCATAPRSMVALPNLVDALITCAFTTKPIPNAPIFHVTDGQSLSVRDLILKMGRLLGKKPTLLPVPVGALHLVGKLFRHSAQIDRLTMPLRMESQATQTALDWRPPLTTDAALEQTIDWYRSSHHRLA